MKIIILGAGQVGSSVAANLVHEDDDITIVDIDGRRLQELQDRLDIRTVVGSAAHPDVLRRAGADDADMVLAVTNSDETNMVACQVAHILFNTTTKIARVRAGEYLAHRRLFAEKAFPVDMVISPEQVVTEYLERLIDHPGALQVLDFADGKVQLVALRAYQEGPLVGHALRELPEHIPKADARVVAIFRGNKPIIPTGDTVIEHDDEVFFLTARENISVVMSELRRADKPYKNVMIAGGGQVGIRLAGTLEKDHRVKLIERDMVRAREIEEILGDTIVLQGNAADEDLLNEENVDSFDIFCAVTNDDEANILSALLAKRMGARKTMAIITRHAYVDLAEHGGIDIAVSPQQATIGDLLRHIRRADVVRVHSLRRGAAEAIETVVHGDQNSSKVVGRAIKDINLPIGTTIGAIVRNNEVHIAHNHTVIEKEDHVILFLVDKNKVNEVERLFQVGITFI